MPNKARTATGIVLASLIYGNVGCSDGSTETYLIGTSVPGSAFSALGEALESAANRSGDTLIEAVETRGSVGNLERLRAGDLHFGLAQGGFEFDDAGLSSVASIDVEYLHVIVPNDSPIHDLRALAGKRIATGARGSGSLAVVQSIAKAASLQPPLVLVERENANEAFEESEIDAAMFVSSLRRELTPLLQSGAYRLIPVPQAKALAVDMYDVRIAEIPPGVYGPNLSIPPKALPTLAVDTNLFVRTDVPDEIVRRLTEALFTYHVQAAARLPGLSEETAQNEADLELHPAARDFYTRNAPLSADQFEIAAFGLAALLTLLSAARWLVHWLRERRLRVDRRIVAGILRGIGEAAVRGPHSDDAKLTITNLLLESQQRWLDGRLDDEELRMIFDAATAHGAQRDETAESRESQTDQHHRPL